MQDHLKLMSSVNGVRLERFQTAVMLSTANHTHSKIWTERKNHYLQIYTNAYGLFVFFFSLRCYGGSVLKPGTSTADTQCDITPPPSTTTEVSLQISSKDPLPRSINSPKVASQSITATLIHQLKTPHWKLKNEFSVLIHKYLWMRVPWDFNNAVTQSHTLLKVNARVILSVWCPEIPPSRVTNHQVERHC